MVLQEEKTMKYVVVLAALALGACGGKVVKLEDLDKHLQTQGYQKVIFQSGRLNCGRFGEGRHFVATKTKGTGKQMVFGQICYKKSKDTVDYKVSVIRNSPLDANNRPTTSTAIQNPWTKGK
jgi:hypothetical protein